MAMKLSKVSHWRQAEQAEFDSMTKRQVFTHMVLSPAKKSIDTQWVHALIYKDGEIYEYKASLRIVQAIAAKLRFDIQQMDVETEFLIAHLEQEEEYIRVPKGVTRALYF